MPPPEFSESARARGWAWDEPQRAQFHRTLEQEGLVAFAPEAEHLIQSLADRPVPDLDETNARIEARWGSLHPQKHAATVRAWELLKEKEPGIARAIVERQLWHYEEFIEHMARVGETMVDMNTPHGFNRVKARELAKIAAEAPR